MCYNCYELQGIIPKVIGKETLDSSSAQNALVTKNRKSYRRLEGRMRIK